MNRIKIRATEYSDDYFKSKSKEFTDKYNEQITELNKLIPDRPYNKKQLKDISQTAMKLYETVEHSMRTLIRKAFFERYKAGLITASLWIEISETLHDNLKAGTPAARKALDLTEKNAASVVIGLPKLFAMMAKFCSPQISYNNCLYKFGRPARILGLSELNMIIIKDFQDKLRNVEIHDPEDPEDIEDYLSTLQTVVAEIEKYVALFLSNGAATKKMQLTAAKNEQILYDLLRRKNSYAKQTRILITDRLDDLTEDEQHVFQHLKWDIVVDLDCQSSKSGLESEILQSITPAPVIYTPYDARYKFQPFSDMYWFRFYKDAQTVLIPRLVSSYVDAFKRFLEGYKGTGGRELLVVSNIRDSSKADIAVELAKMICDKTYSAEEELPDLNTETDIRFCALNNQSCYPKEHYEEFQPVFMSFDLTIHQVLNKMSEDFPAERTDTKKVFIDDQNHTMVLETPAYRCFDIIYAEIEKMQELSKEEDILDPKSFFLAKAPISWYAIDHKQHIISDTLEKIIADMGQEPGDIIHSNYLLPYDPGVGGTTALRTLAFHMSKRMPAVILKQYAEKETWKECKELNKETGCAVFIAVDENLVSMDEFSDLCDALNQNHVQHIAVYAMRDTQAKKHKQNFKKLEKLDGLNYIETTIMANRLTAMIKDDVSYSPEEKTARIESLEGIVRSGQHNYPFILCMYAFEKEFRGTKPYIKHFLSEKYNLTEQQKEILLWIAIITVHTSYSLDTGLFAAGKTFFSGPANDVADHLLRFDDQKGQKKVRFLHQLLAGEVIRQILFPDKDTYSINDLHKALCEKLLKLIAYITDTGSACSLTLKVNTLKDLFILKEPFDYEHATASLSPLMNELYKGVFNFLDYQGDFGTVNKSQRILELRRIMEMLVECYPDEPHFHAHFGRFLAYMDNRDNRFELALEQADRAIELEANDCILYHIRANCRRNMLREKIQAYRKRYERSDVSEEELKQRETEILKLAERASEDFEISRQNENAAGFLCDVRMCISLVDFCKEIHKTDYQTIASPNRISQPEIVPYSAYYCRAMELFKEIDEIDQISERTILRADIQKLQAQILKFKDELKDILGFWENYISRTANSLDRYRAIRFCINSQSRNNSFDHIQDKAVLEKLIDYSQILLDQSDSISTGDLAQWFTLKTLYSRLLLGAEDPIMLEDMMADLTRWQNGIQKQSSMKLVSMLRFIVACIQVLQGDSRGSAVVSKYTSVGNFSPKYYLREGESIRPILGDLYRYQENEAKEHYQKITGELIQLPDNSYRIDAQGIQVYCGMQRQEKIRESDLHQNVEFGMLFTLQDARALFNTVIPKKKDRNKKPPLGIGSIVTGEVIDIRMNQCFQNHLVFVSFNDALNTYGMVNVSEEEELPQLGDKLQLYIIGERKPFYIKQRKATTDCWIMKIDR